MTETIELMGVEALKDLRKRILQGYEPTDDEVALVLASLRADRSKITAKSSSKAKETRTPLDLNALFSGDKKDGN